jgi:hypothetical protein
MMKDMDLEQPSSNETKDQPTVTWDHSTESDESKASRPQKVSNHNRQLSVCSQKYDHDHKGYLNDTEKALRNMDAENKGFLDIDKMYLIMETLQTEQKKSGDLIDTIRHEQKKTMNLKRGVIVLCCFAFLLALANIGTSFAAAILSKDTTVSRNNDFTTLTGERLGTTAKVVQVSMQSVSEERRRHLQESAYWQCLNVPNNNKANCMLAGEMTNDEASRLYQQFCPDYPESDSCLTGGVEKVVLNCNGKRSTIFGGANLPETGPTLSTLDQEYTIYPTQTQGYATQQTQYATYGSAGCRVDSTVGIYCPTDGSACAVMAYFNTLPDCATNETVVALCGEPK